ncbi:MAG: Nif3-like dinuclear metal center hexameric protein [Firmicutes bacterium]|nr:Nif3-like dinuclear metal center hexameric protein [Bacillota bacterium]
MTTVADVLQFMEDLAPSSLMESWDNGGLLCGQREQRVHTILVALDPFHNVIQEAIDRHADLIVTHHPLIFGDALWAVTGDTETGRCLMTLIQHGIAAINAHTNLDLAPGGINDALAAALGLENPEIIRPLGTLPDGRAYGLLRAGTVGEQPLEAFLSRVKERLHCDGLRYVDGGRTVRKVAVGGGACAGEMGDAISAGCDTLVTSDVKYNQFRTAWEKGLNLIDAGHFHTENPAMPILAEKLRGAFPDVTVLFSETHRDCMKFFQ